MRNIDRLLDLLGRHRANLPELARGLLRALADQLRDVADRVAAVELELLNWRRASPSSQRLATIPGLRPITASAIAASVGDAGQFSSGRQLAAWLGLVPQQHSSGGKERFGGISKRGNVYIRRLLIHGARAVVGWRKRRPVAADGWLQGLVARRPVTGATVAMANKSARIPWALLTSEADDDRV